MEQDVRGSIHTPFQLVSVIPRVPFASFLNLIMANLKKLNREQAGVLEKAEYEPIDAGRKAETDLTVRNALRYYRPAVMWSALISIATIMESYDMQIIHSFYAFPQFQKKYGVQLEEGGYTITAEWQLALNLVALLGLMTGTFISGSVSERFGARKVIMVSLLALSGFVAITFFAPSIEVLLVGELLWYASVTTLFVFTLFTFPLLLARYPGASLLLPPPCTLLKSALCLLGDTSQHS